MEQIFIDSSAFFAMGDQSSREGEKINSFILHRQPSLVTTNFVFAETLSLVTKRAGKFKGIQVGEKILFSQIIRLVYLDEEIQNEAWQLYKKYKDKDFDFIDATSFVLCQRHKIKEVLTLDTHFAQMGFKIFP